jgi:GntR family transcriptional regulator
MAVIERSNPLPLYYQLKEVLKQQIRSGHLAPNTAIPSEPELVARYRVSRATVRQALTELVHEGLLYRQHGKGTFVCEPRVQQQTFSELTSFTSEMRKHGKRPGGLLIISELVRGSDAIRKQLQLTDEEQIARFERLRNADGQPVAYEVDYLPYPRAGVVYQRAQELGEGSLYSIMAAEGLSPSFAEQVVRADRPTTREAELLRVQSGEPGLRFTSTIFDQIGSPVAYTESFYAGNRYEVQLTLRVKV